MKHLYRNRFHFTFPGVIWTLLALIAFSQNSYSQVAINSSGNSPDPSALLDISSSNKGLLIPRVALTGTTDNTTVPGAANGLMVINIATVSDVTPGLYVRSGGQWIRFAFGGSTGEAWNITGNSGTNITSNFIGTTDSVSLRFRVNGKIAGLIQRTDEINVGGNTHFGLEAGLNTALLTGYHNSYFGDDAGRSNISGVKNSFFGNNAGYNNTESENSFFGNEAGYTNSTGYWNSFFGNRAGYANSTGDFNSFFGESAGINSTGNSNSFFGQYAGQSNVSGSGNTAIGHLADMTFNNLQNATAIGYHANVNSSNSLVLGGYLTVDGEPVETKVGIGTSDPDTKLEVNGATGVTVRISSSGAGQNLEFYNSFSGADFRINNDGTLNFLRSTDNFTSTTEIAAFTGTNVRPGADNAFNLGGSSYRWAEVWAANGTIQTSDERLKKDIRTMGPTLDKIGQLNPVYFRWENESLDNGREHIGFVAQDLRQIIPQAVVDHEWVENPETGKREWIPTANLGVNYSELIPVLVKAIQEQQAMIEQLQEENRRIRELIAN